MKKDWYFPFPEGEFEDQESAVAQWLAEDPVACTISDQEAEAFFAVAEFVLSMGRAEIPWFFSLLGVKVPQSGPRALVRRNVCTLRQWKHSDNRKRLMWLITNSSNSGYPIPSKHPSLWTDEMFSSAWADGFRLIRLVQIRRYLGKDDNLFEWLQQLAPYAERQYQFCVNLGRIWLRRIVHPMGIPGHVQGEAAAALQESLTQELRERDRVSGTLRRNVRRLEQDRRRLRKAARRAEHEARQAFLQARGEVRAVRRDLKARLAEQERELAALAQRLDQESNKLRAQIASVRSDFARQLSDPTAVTSLPVLQGRTITITGETANREIYRLLVESLGGLLLESDGDVEIPNPARIADVERELCRIATRQVLIKCDGLYRRKGKQPGIAISAFQVLGGPTELYRKSAVVSCGPLAGSFMAEYGAVAMALSWLARVGPSPGAKAEIWTDCKRLVQRLQTRHPKRIILGCTMLDQTVRHLIQLLERQQCSVHIRWVPRDNVYEMDRLCDRAYREARWYHRRNPVTRVPLAPFLHSVSRKDA